MSFVNIFPTELIEMVFSYLSVQDLVNSSLVCVSWYEASNTNSVWRAAIKRSTPKDRFRILSNLDRFTGIASNYDDNHCFQVDRQSPSNLSSINPWKLSLCQNNFVRSNWHGSHNTTLARHQIKFEDDMEIVENISVVYSSTSSQDHLYLPILAKKTDQPDMDFLLIRLDGTPRITQKILSTDRKFPYVCIDRDCVVWLQNGQVKYLSLIEYKDSSHIDNLGTLIPDSFLEVWKIDMKIYYMMTMNDKYIVAGFQDSVVKIWCKKTKQLKLTHETKQTISNVKCVINACYLDNERIYFKHSFRNAIISKRCFIEIYDIEKDKVVENPFSSLKFDSIAFSDKYYAMYSELEDYSVVSVHDIDTNEVKIRVNVDIPNNYYGDPRKVWIFDDTVLYFEQGRLKILSLVDWNISNGISVQTIEDYYWIYDICNSFVLAEKRNKLKIWDWKLERQLHELRLDDATRFYIDETRLVAFSCKKYVNVIGFW